MGMRLATWRKESKLGLSGKSRDGKKVHKYIQKNSKLKLH